MNIFYKSAVIMLLAAVNLSASGEQEPEKAMPADQPGSAEISGSEEAVFAGGCFWGVEAVFESLAGVIEAESGYSGGNADTAEYRLVSTGATGHAEAVRVIYDPGVINYSSLLEVFFNIAHDPTQLNYQGPDVGTQYRSAIFYTSDEQQRAAVEAISRLEKERRYRNSVVTEVTPLQAFYPAEDYHQDFIRKNPEHPYVVYWDIPKLEHLMKEYPRLLRRN